MLGLAVGASPLEVASAYVSLCEELDRELAAAPTEALRHRCLEARAEIDSAYQHCAAAPLAADTAGATNAAAGYETQVARATFEAPVAEPAAPDPVLVRILADPDPPPRSRARRARRRPLRRLATAAALLLFAAAGALGYVWWSDPERLHVLTRYLPLPPDPQLVEAQTGAEYLRRRVAEERHDIQRRAEEAAARVARLQADGRVPRAHPTRTHAPTARWSRRRRARRSRSICPSSPSGTSSRAMRSPRHTDAWSRPPSSRAAAKPSAP